MLECRLRRDKDAAEVDVDHQVHLFERGFLERLGNSSAGVVDQHVQLAEGGDGLCDGGLDGGGIGGIGLNCDRLLASDFDCLYDRGCGVGALGVGDGYFGAVSG
jgi:hypothetical protein